MGDSLGLVGKRLLLLFRDGGPAAGGDQEQAVWTRNWVRGTVRAVSVIGLASPGVEVSGEERTTRAAAAGLTVSVYAWMHGYAENNNSRRLMHNHRELGR